MKKSRFDTIKERHTKTFQKASKHGKMDPKIEPLCEFIASTKNYYTSSSCSGRIILLERQGNKKIDNYFHRRWHRNVSFEELNEGINEKILGELWFKVDPFILHIGCRNIENAKKILSAMKEAGVKRGGILVAEEEKFLVEFQGTEKMELPLKIKEKKLVDEEYLKIILKKANELLEKNFKRLEKVEKTFKKNLN